MSEGEGEGQGGEGGAGGEGGGGGAGGEGGAAELLKGAGGTGGEGGAGGEGGEGGSGGGGDNAWLEGFSDKQPGEGKKSNRSWLEKKQFKSADAAIDAYRDLEARLLAGDKLVVPKEGDPPEAFEAFYKATGRPDAAEDYKVEVAEGQEVDEGLAGKMREVFFENGGSAQLFEAAVAAFNEHGAELLEGQGDAAIQAKKEGTDALRKDWGKDFDANVAHANSAMAALELDGDFVTRMEAGLGTADTMKLLSKIGLGVSEDSLIGGGGQKFSMGLDAAKAELKAMKSGEKAKALLAGDADLKKRREFLLNVVAQHEAAANKAAQQS